MYCSPQKYIIYIQVLKNKPRKKIFVCYFLLYGIIVSQTTTPAAKSPYLADERFAVFRKIIQWINRHAPEITPLQPRLSGKKERTGLIITLILMLIFIAFFLTYIVKLQNANLTNAEDMGIMDQVLWNTTHGQFWRETICNTITDTNCIVGASRWAIHFEPSMLLLVPIYWLIPGPHTLQFIQVVGVSIGALPAYWLGSRRWQNQWAGVLLAVFYLFNPALRGVIIDDFHMVALAAPALMFAVYYMFSRNNIGLFIAVIFAMGTKEQVPLDVFMIGAMIALMQRRWRLGAVIAGLSVCWAVAALWVIHAASPIGESPTAMRYNGVFGVITHLRLIFTTPSRLLYLAHMFDDSGWLGIFAPWTFLPPLPDMLLNAVSANQTQYSGFFQYNADIIPFLTLAALEGTVGAHTLMQKYIPALQQKIAEMFHKTYSVKIISATLMIALIVAGTAEILRTPSNRILNPILMSNAWPTVTAHAKLAYTFYQMIPADASVTAQANLVPHLSERHEIYQYPYNEVAAQYVLLDITSEYYPEQSYADYGNSVKQLLQSGQYSLVRAQDGYILLKLNTALTAQSQNTAITSLPKSFCPAQPINKSDVLQLFQQLAQCGA